jgi:ketosteroid isomerase-like protein
MRSSGFAVILFWVAMAFAAPQNVTDSGAVTRVIALEHAWNQAEERKDIKALDSILDTGMVYVDYDGSLLTKSAFLSKISANDAHPQLEITESMTARVFGNTAVVTGVYVAKGVENGKAYTRRGRFIDTWVFKGSAWVCIASQATPITR